MKILFASILLFSFYSHAGKSYHLMCLNNDVYTDMGKAIIALDTTVTVNSYNDYFIEGGNFYFFIEGPWTDQDIEIEKVSNFSKYTPRIYDGYAKFPNVAKRFFGLADFLVPHNVLMKGEKNFEGIFILSSVEDHWGDTVSANCILK